MDLSRRTFFGLTALALTYTTTCEMGGDEPQAIDAEAGELVFVGATRDPVRVKLGRTTTWTFGMITQQMAPGSSIPVHLHEKEDELILIQSGEGTARLGDERVPLRTGSTLFVPRGTWHAGQNTGATIMNWVAIYSPAGFEQYFLEIGARTRDAPPPRLTLDQMQALDRRYGIKYVR
jgi:mannose-6-phosphate isomerase-like protein (cupin superfamily)